MPLSAKEILKHIEKGNIFIDPFVPENVKGASVDVRLGHFYFSQIHNDGFRGIRNPWSLDAAQRVWLGPYDACCATALADLLENSTDYPFADSNDDLIQELGLQESDKIIVIPAHKMILAHTEEFIGSNASFVGDLRGRSSVYRSALTVSSDGNWGDPAFFGRWSLKIENQTDDIVILPVGRRIAQIVFHEVQNGEAYATENGGGKYQTTEDHERIKREWRPEMILPRLHLDREVRQAAIETS